MAKATKTRRPAPALAPTAAEQEALRRQMDESRQAARATAQARREARAAAERAARRRRTILSAAAGLIATALVAGGLFFWYSYTHPGESYPDQGNEHIASADAPHAPYNSDPPTSGPHLSSLMAWGVYTETMKSEEFVHNLEDAGVITGRGVGVGGAAGGSVVELEPERGCDRPCMVDQAAASAPASPSASGVPVSMTSQVTSGTVERRGDLAARPPRPPRGAARVDGAEVHLQHAPARRPRWGAFRRGSRRRCSVTPGQRPFSACRATSCAPPPGRRCDPSPAPRRRAPRDPCHRGAGPRCPCAS